MYAIIECGGKQYKVEEGQLVRVEKLAVEVGATVTIDQVLMLGGDKTVIGTPLVDGAAVNCKVVNQDKEKKILVFHYKAKKNIRKRYGHRQPYTSLLIEKIITEGAKKAAPKAAQKATITEQAATAETVPVEAAVKPVSAPKAAVVKTATAKAAPAKSAAAPKATTVKAAPKTAAKPATVKAEKPAAAKATTAKAAAPKAAKAETATKTTAVKKTVAKKTVKPE